MGDDDNENRPSNWLESDAVIEMMNLESQHIASIQEDSNELEPIKVQVDSSNITLFPIFARRKERVHVALKLKHRQYDLTRDEVRSHYNDDGKLILPFEDLSQQNIAAFDNFGDQATIANDSMFNNRVHMPASSRNMASLNDLFENDDVTAQPTEQPEQIDLQSTVKPAVSTYSTVHNKTIVGIDMPNHDTYSSNNMNSGSTGSRNLFAQGLKMGTAGLKRGVEKGMGILMSNTAAAKRKGRSRMENVRSLSNMYIHDFDDTLYDRVDTEREDTEMRQESIMSGSQKNTTAAAPAPTVVKTAKKNDLLSQFVSNVSPKQSRPAQKSPGTRARAGSMQAELLKQHEHGKKLLKLAHMVQKHEDVYRRRDSKAWTGDGEAGYWELPDQGSRKVQEVALKGIPRSAMSVNPRLTKRHLQSVHRLPAMSGGASHDDLDLIILSELSTMALIRHTLVVISRTSGKDHSSKVLDEIELVISKLIRLDLAEVDTQVHKADIYTLQAAMHTDLRYGLSSHATQLVDKRGVGHNTLVYPISSFCIWAWIKYSFLGFAAVFWLFVVIGITAYAIRGLMRVATVNYDVFFMVGCVLFVNTGSFAVQWTHSAFNRLPSDIIPSTAKVIRDEQSYTVDTSDIVLGDVLILRRGDTVPADCRVISCSDDLCCSVQPLSGDDRFIVKSANWTDENMFYSQNMLLAGSVIVRGSCQALVVRIGVSSIVGKCFIDSSLGEYEDTTQFAAAAEGSPSKRLAIFDELHLFFIYCTVLSCVLFLFFGLYGTRWYTFNDSIINTYTVSFSNAPEGMIASMVCCMMLATRKLRKRGIIIKRLEVVENLALSKVLIIDKTGTFTLNKPIVTSVLLPSKQVVWCDTCLESEHNSLYSLQVENHRKLHDTHFNEAAISQTIPDNQILIDLVVDVSLLYLPGLPVLPCAQLIFLSALLCVPENDKHPFFNSEAKLGTVDTALLAWCQAQTIIKAKRTDNVNLDGEYTDTCFYKKSSSPVPSVKAIYSRFHSEEIDSRQSSPSEAMNKVKFRQSSQKDMLASVLHTFERVLHLPYSMRDKISFSICRHEREQFAVIKGSIEQILDLCTYTTIPDKSQHMVFDNMWVKQAGGTEQTMNSVHLLTVELKLRIMQEMEYMCTSGASILAFAYINLSHYPANYKFQSHPVNFEMKNVIFTGLLSYVDSPRPNAEASMDTCFKNNIQVMMMTADHPISAEAQAKKGGMFPETCKILHMDEFTSIQPDDMTNHCLVVNAENWTGFSPKLWHKLELAKAVVFARVSPQLKGEIIFVMRMHLQRVVAATGSNMHDADALKCADAGIAFASASSVAKEHADVVVTTNQLSDVVQSLDYSRLFVQNWRKAIIYQTQKMLPTLICSTLSLCTFNVPSITSTMNVMLVDVVLDLLPGTALMYEKKEELAQERTEGRVINFRMLFFCYFIHGILMSAGCWMNYILEFESHGIYFYDLYQKGHLYFADTDYLNLTLRERTHIYRRVKGAVLISFTLQQFIVIFSRRRLVAPAMRWFKPMDLFDNMYLNASLVISIGLLLIVIFNEQCNIFFDVVPPTAMAWVYTLIPGFFVLILLELQKLMVRQAGPTSFIGHLFNY